MVHVQEICKFNNCNALYMGLSLKYIQKLELVQNTAAKLLIGTVPRDHNILFKFHQQWLSFSFCAQFNGHRKSYTAWDR